MDNLSIWNRFLLWSNQSRKKGMQKEEEKRNIEKFGVSYRDYIERVSRINSLTGIIRQMRRRKENKKGRT